MYPKINFWTWHKYACVPLGLMWRCSATLCRWGITATVSSAGSQVVPKAMAWQVCCVSEHCVLEVLVEQGGKHSASVQVFVAKSHWVVLVEEVTTGVPKCVGGHKGTFFLEEIEFLMAFLEVEICPTRGCHFGSAVLQQRSMPGMGCRAAGAEWGGGASARMHF